VTKTAVILLGIFLAAGAAQAQIPTGGNIFIGYSYSGGDVSATACPQICPPGAVAFQPATRSAGFNGWEGSLEGKFLPWIGIVVDVSRHYASRDFTVVCFLVPGTPQCPPSPQTVHSNISTYLLGPRVSVPVGKFTPFAHALFGAGHISDSGAASNSNTSFATAIGGGLDYRLIKGLAVRVQGDEVHTRFFSGGQDHIRLSTGLDIRF
jgi:opacity protein-like surface antigen